MHVVVADDHPLYREAVCLRLRRLYADASVDGVDNIDALMAFADSAEPIDLVFVDLRMPGMDGGASIGRIVQAFPTASVVLMSGEASPADVRAAIRSGAKGYLPKTIPSDLFTTAVSLLAAGGTYLPSEVLRDETVVDKAATVPTERSIEHLTPRQQAVLIRLTSGASNKEIARDLGLSEITVKLHVRQILKKVGARNRAEATAVAIKSGLI